MLRQMLKSKIHRAMITGLELNYEGSIACDPEWLRAADVLPGEKVLVANLNNRARFETYAIIGKDRQISLRGAAARLEKIGDRVIIMAFGLMDEEESRSHRPAVIYMDEHDNSHRLSLVMYRNIVLRAICAPIVTFDSSLLRNLMREMFELMQTVADIDRKEAQ